MFNSARWLRATLSSVLAQSVHNVEVVLVDDGSQDASCDIALSVMDERVRLIRQPNSGASVARNTGIAAAHGEFLQFLDADDLLAPDKLERQLARLRGQPAAVATSEWGRFYGDDPMQATFEEEGVWRDLAPVDWAICSAMGGGMMATAGWLVPRAVAERAGPWSATRSPNDDGEYFNRVILASERVLFTRGARVFYRSGVDGWSQARSASAVAGLLESYESIEKHLRAAEDSPRTREAAATLYQRFIFDVYPGHAALVRRAEQAVVRLGGSPLRPPSGGVFGKVSRLTGWKVAKRIQTLARLVSHR